MKSKKIRSIISIGLAVAMAFPSNVVTNLMGAGTVFADEEQETFCGYQAHAHGDECYTNVLACGQEESAGNAGHTHTADCYQNVTTLICGQEESAGHTHTDSCYSVTPSQLICGQEESAGHTHDMSCYDENGNLICGLEVSAGHTHTGACYSDEVRTLVCGMNESAGHTHTDACYQTEQVLICGLEESALVEGHTHTESCYDKQLTCGIEEHVHDLSCYSNPSADVEDANAWEATLPQTLTGVWAEDVVSVAKSQIGYSESSRNYEVAEDGSTKGYTRYGAFFGTPYADWCAMFASFCLYYAGVPTDVMPEDTEVTDWIVTLSKMGLYSDDDYVPSEGDLIFFDENKNDDIIADHVGIVEYVKYKNDMPVNIFTIEGNCDNAVRENKYDVNDTSIVGYGVLPEQPTAADTAEEAKADETEADIDADVETEYEAESESESESETESEIIEDELEEADNQTLSSLSLMMNGDFVNLKAENTEEEGAEVRLYFENFALEEDESYTITGPADISAGEEMIIPEFTVVYADGNEDTVQAEYTFDGESAYIGFELPADSSVDTNLMFDVGYDIMLEATMGELSDQMILEAETDDSEAEEEMADETETEEFDEAKDDVDDFDQAISTTGYDIMPMSVVSDTDLWWFDDYYTTGDAYNVHETDDFTLKYQWEFHASEDLEAGSVVITFPASIGTYRSGSYILPSDIGVPYGTPDEPTETKSSPFNYYYADENGNVISNPSSYSGTVYLVFWNWRDINSGTNAMVQVLYKDIDIMQVPDGTSWSNTPTVSVTHNGETETKDGYSLSGDVDTEVLLSSATKKPYSNDDLQYTPELYTETQVKNYIQNDLDDKFSGDNFDNYIYIVWKVTATGSATQRWTLEISDSTTAGGALKGEVVGYMAILDSPYYNHDYNKNYSIDDGILTIASSSDRTIETAFYVVTAYDKTQYEALAGGDYESVVISNTVTVNAEPYDGIDPDITKTASISTSWSEYHWEYHGDIIGIDKRAYNANGTKAGNYYSSVGSYSAYKELFDYNNQKGEDTGSFHYWAETICNGYPYTHVTPYYDINGNYVFPSNAGEYIDGTWYEIDSYDDILYIYPNGAEQYAQALTKDDYYFDGISITVTDKGYDIWEDDFTTCETIDDVDQDVYIYAMFADDETDTWEYVDKVAWDTDGKMNYSFSSSAIAREPYRVKVVHNGVGYRTVCNMELYVTLKANAPTIADAISTYESKTGGSVSYFTIENLDGVSGERFQNYESLGFFQDQNVENGNYSEYDSKSGVTLIEFTENMYDMLLMRHNSYVKLSELEPHASASKSYTLENDTANERVLANYYLTAYEGYYVSSSSLLDQLKEIGLSLPDRNEVVYYDLLPYGMEFNASTKVTAGRITTISGSSWSTNYRAWDSSDVSVTIEDEDIIPDWNGTGRTLLKFHIHYNGDDTSEWSRIGTSYDYLWLEGFGIYFQAYYDWKMIDEVDNQYNIAAYIVEDSSDNLLGHYDSEVFKDDGSYNGSSAYDPFKISDLNSDRITDKYTNMYARTRTSTNIATSGNSGITKKVRADDDAVAEYDDTAVAGLGRGYTYRISVTNIGNGTLSDIVVYDNLEYSVEEDRNGEAEGGTGVFEGLKEDEINNHWTGTFNGLSIDALTEQEIDAVVYYNANRNATISETDKSIPSGVLTQANGWYTEDEWFAEGYTLADVQAFAADLSKYADGSAVELESGDSLSFDAHMIAPSDEQYVSKYAFNDTSFYSVNTSFTGSVTSSTVVSDTVRVELSEAGEIEVIKQTDGDVPSAFSTEKFTFVLKRDGEILPNQEYLTYTWDDESKDWIDSGVVSSTDINGEFAIRANQKAVFYNLAGYKNATVEEIDSVFWDENESKSATNTTISYTFTNIYRSPVYLYKTALTTDLAEDDFLENAQFTFKIYVDTNGDGEYEPYTNGLYAYVSQALTDGSTPEIYEYGYTDNNGCVTIGLDDVIAFFPVDEDGNVIGVNYMIEEVDISDDWIVDTDSTTGSTSVYGKPNTITNYYKYRSLTLTKNLTNFDEEDDACTDEWTFKITDADGNAVTGLHWYMIDASGNPVMDKEDNPIEGYLDDNGEFTFTGAGSNHRVIIEGLIAGEEYTVAEVGYDKTRWDYMGDGVYTMPDYSVNRNGSITNKYLLKDLSVSKLVLSKDSGSTEANNTEFIFTLEKLAGGNYMAEAGITYTVDGVEYQTDEKGQFTLKNNQTALFDDIGYEHDQYRITETADDTYWQVYPANGDPYESELGVEGDSVQFVNGDFDNIVTITKALVGMDSVGKSYVDIVKDDNNAETLADGAYTVDVTFGVYDSDELVTSKEGSLIDFTDSNDDYPYVYIKVTNDGITLKSYNGGLYTDTLTPYDYIYIAEIVNYSVKAFEDEGMTRVALEVAADYVEAVGSDEILSEGDVMSGEGISNDTITLVNNISSANAESEIYKLMSEESSEVPTGAKIVFRVEIYDEASDSWTPANGIRYIIFDDEGPVTGVENTGNDGKITVSKTDNGYPVIRFVDDEVYANVWTDMEDGQLRIVELLDESDDDWGWLVGYDGNGWINGPSLDITFADTFIDGNDAGLMFEVEKYMEDTSSDGTFTFQLKEITAVSKLPVTSTSDILESIVGSNVHYTVYDTETGERVFDGYTDSNGRFTLKAGQYAVFDVPTGTSWIVNELITAGYELTDAEANTEAVPRATIVDEVNGVYQVESSSYLTHSIVLTLTDNDGDPIPGGTFDLYKDGALYESGFTTDGKGQITVNELKSGLYYFVQTATADGYKMPDDTETDSVEIKDSLVRSQTYYIDVTNADSYTVKYAVAIYGIQHDEDENGNKLGLTFGPATGESYISTYKAHLTKDEYESGSNGVCLHWMTWDEIVEQSKTNPTVFQSCLENGCTHSVELKLNDTIKGTDYSGAMDDGDGAGILRDSINSEYRRWNGTSSSYSNEGGWPASKVRANLNGKDEHTNTDDSKVAGGNYTLDAGKALISCFPSVLQNAIVPKAVDSNTVYNSEDEGDMMTTYDKLWLFSYKELDGYTSSYNLRYEGEEYERILDYASIGYLSASNLRIGYYETGSAYYWWERSLNAGSSYSVYGVNTGGSVSGSYRAGGTYGLAPGFCLE